MPPPKRTGGGVRRLPWGARQAPRPALREADRAPHAALATHRDPALRARIHVRQHVNASCVVQALVREYTCTPQDAYIPALPRSTLCWRRKASAPKGWASVPPVKMQQPRQPSENTSAALVRAAWPPRQAAVTSAASHPSPSATLPDVCYTTALSVSEPLRLGTRAALLLRVGVDVEVHTGKRARCTRV